MPSPTDLARARPRPAPAPKPPRGRGRAEAEKERARRALRDMVTSPATDFAAMDTDAFSDALKCACGDGIVAEPLVAEAARRAAAGTSPSRDLHQVLFVAASSQATWASAREAAMAAVSAAPHRAVEVIGMEAQRLGSGSLRTSESAEPGGFTARASLDRDGETVAGDWCIDNSKKRARQRAAVSLLAALTGLPLPEAARPTETASSAPESSGAESGIGAPDKPGKAASPAMTASELEDWLDYEVSQPEPDPEFAHLVTARAMSARSVYLLLFEADPHGWAEHRALAAEALLANPSFTPGVLSMCTQSRSWPPLAYLEPAAPGTGASVAVAYVSTPDGPVVGEPALAASPKAARAAAGLSLIRDLAPSVPEPERTAGDGTGAGDTDRNPVGVLNELAQTGVIADLSYGTGTTGPAHQPVFTCTARCGHASGARSATAEGRTKAEAKSAAAAALAGEIGDAERSARARLARARREEAREAIGIFARLARSGCPVEFAVPAGTGSAGFRIGGDLPDPLAGQRLTVAEALPVLAALHAGIHDGAPAASASARSWAAAARTALEAVAARRVYPAADGDGRDRWRLIAEPLASDTLPPDEVAAFFDAAADALLRPPGARFVIGDLPYAARPRELDDEALAWADHSADQAEGTQPGPLTLRISPPGPGDPLLRATIYPTPFNGTDLRFTPAQHRLLRRAARDWAPLAHVLRDGALGGTEAAELLGPAGNRLAAHGITVAWPADLITATSGLETRTVVSSRAGTGSGSGAEPLTLTGSADLTWQLVLDGEPLTEEETAAVAAAVSGIVLLRGRWAVIDSGTAERARKPKAGTLTGAQALTAALTGQVTVKGADIACTAAGALADLVMALREGTAGAPGTAAEPSTEGLRATLRGYQRQAVAWLDRVTSLGFGALLADDMGLGKTLTVIAFHRARVAAGSGTTGPALVVCPASLLANWEREFARFAPDTKVRRHHGPNRSLDGLAAGEVVVTSYGTLIRDAERLAAVGWDLVVADEAQYVKNHRSQATRALRAVPAKARVAVTGTPAENSLSELWAILDWTSPGLFGTLKSFRDTYGREAEREGDGDAARRLSRLIAPFVLRRRKTDPGVAPELPDKVTSDRYVQLTREQAALYSEALSRDLAAVTGSAGIERRGQVLRLLQSLRQICNTPAHFLRESPADWNPSAQAERSEKLQVLDELLESIVVAGEAALIFTGYVSMGHLIAAHLKARGYEAGFLHGGVPVPRRQEIVDRFQKGDGDALILSVRAGGTGLNLTRAGHVIHFDRPWNPAVEDQATDRAHRIGQHRLVEVHHLIAEGTVEDRIAELLARKRGLAEAVLTGGETALTELTDSELAALVRLGDTA